MNYVDRNRRTAQRAAWHSVRSSWRSSDNAITSLEFECLFTKRETHAMIARILAAGQAAS
ncbi:hypothetical protein AOQ73_36300 [Bradyrhizobium pachyrhizi]|nr:hypothetical protein AOQ73_36300 [Bradyrhizobium pachyrhizi]